MNPIRMARPPAREPERADIWPLTLGTLREHRLANSARDPSHPAVLRISAADEWLTGIVLTRRWVTGIGPVSRTRAKPPQVTALSQLGWARHTRRLQLPAPSAVRKPCGPLKG